jgi:hypothetical protein
MLSLGPLRTCHFAAAVYPAVATCCAGKPTAQLLPNVAHIEPTARLSPRSLSALRSCHILRCWRLQVLCGCHMLRSLSAMRSCHILRCWRLLCCCIMLRSLSHLPCCHLLSSLRPTRRCHMLRRLENNWQLLHGAQLESFSQLS